MKRNMKYNVPPKYVELRRTLARSHNRRVMVLFVLTMVFLLAGVKLTASRDKAVFGALAAGVLFEILGVIFIIRLAKKQSVAMGYVCPLCHGPLYDGRGNRLGLRGECPCCKSFISDKLKE